MDQAQSLLVVLEADPVPGCPQPMATDDRHAGQWLGGIPVRHRGLVQLTIGGRPEQHRVHRPVAHGDGRHRVGHSHRRAGRGGGWAGASAPQVGQPQRPLQHRRDRRRWRQRRDADHLGGCGQWWGLCQQLPILGKVQQPTGDRQPTECGQGRQDQSPSPPTHQTHPPMRAERRHRSGNQPSKRSEGRTLTSGLGAGGGLASRTCCHRARHGQDEQLREPLTWSVWSSKPRSTRPSPRAIRPHPPAEVSS